MNNSRKRTKYLGLTAVMASLTTVMTAYVCHIPIPATGGYIHFGDSLIYLAATLLPMPYAMAVGAIGGGLADLLTAPMWALPTVVIKMLIVVPFTRKDKKIVNVRNVVALVVAFFITATGYYFAETLIFGYELALIMSISGSFIQGIGSSIAFIVFGLALDKMKIKNKI